jgi:hypothetical protein
LRPGPERAGLREKRASGPTPCFATPDRCSGNASIKYQQYRLAVGRFSNAVALFTGGFVEDRVYFIPTGTDVYCMSCINGKRQKV